MNNDNKRDDLQGCADAMISLRHDDVMDDAAWLNAMRVLVSHYESALLDKIYHDGYYATGASDPAKGVSGNDGAR